MTRILYPVALAAALLCGCGTAASPAPTAPPATPRDQREQRSAGRIVLRGDVAPDQFGPLALSGTYRVTFAQRGSGVDFAKEVPFTAHLEQARGSGAPRSRKLFQTAARTGSAVLTVKGRWTVLVDFGDSPFTLTFTPR